MRILVVAAALALPCSGALAETVAAPAAGKAVPPAPVSAAPPVISPAPSGAPAALAPAANAVPPVPSGPFIPALTPISLEIGSDLSSKTSKSGDTFPIRLHEAIVIDGKELVPAGASGMGEVVFTKKSGMAGSGGELILAARWLDVGGRHMRLRSLRLGGAGKDFTRSVDNFNMAAAASFPPLALLGFMVSGSEIAVARGAIAEAKIAEGFPIDSPAVAASPVAALAAVAVGNVALAMPAQIAVSTTSKITKGGVSQ